MMIVADQDRVEDGDRVIIFNGVTIQELRKFDSDPAPLCETELSVLNLAAAVSEAELTSPAVGASSDCVLADFAEAETE